MKSYSSREILRLLKQDGWYEIGCKGRVTVRHPVKDLSLNDLKSIEKQSGLHFE